MQYRNERESMYHSCGYTSLRTGRLEWPEMKLDREEAGGQIRRALKVTLQCWILY